MGSGIKAKKELEKQRCMFTVSMFPQILKNYEGQMTYKDV